IYSYLPAMRGGHCHLLKRLTRCCAPVKTCAGAHQQGTTTLRQQGKYGHCRQFLPSLRTDFPTGEIEPVQPPARAYPHTLGAILRQSIYRHVAQAMVTHPVVDEMVFLRIVAGQTTGTGAYPQLALAILVQGGHPVIGQRTGLGRTRLVGAETVAIPAAKAVLG